MGINDRLKRLARHTTPTTTTIPAAVLQHKVAMQRRVIGQFCREEIEAGRMTEDEFRVLAHKLDQVWHPW
jgi:hypothetical protein